MFLESTENVRSRQLLDRGIIHERATQCARRISRRCVSSVQTHVNLRHTRCDSRVRNKLVSSLHPSLPCVNARSRFRRGLYGDLEYATRFCDGLSSRIRLNVINDSNCKRVERMQYALSSFFVFLPLYVRKILICVTSFQRFSRPAFISFIDDMEKYTVSM